ncbi:MAG TPA: PIG-L family deacetylase [Actinomycetota bacterium]
MKTDITILSPHLDDGVLSLGGLIGREAAAGRSVEIVTCYTAGPPLEKVTPERRVFADYTTRRAEDERALAVLGASRHWLDLRERALRRPPLRRPMHAFRTPPRMEDFAELPAIGLVIAELLNRGADVYAPLGVGNHVDHVEVALAALGEMLKRGAFERVRFYEDSYALSGACRRKHFVARRHTWRRFNAPAWASPRVGALLLAIALSARGPRLDDYMTEASRLEWSCEPAPMSTAEEDRKLAAVAEYRSQVKTLGGIRRVRPFLRRGHRVLGGEPIWRCRPGGMQ